MTRWVVAGGGTAGVVAAHRLATAGHEVVLLESGPAEPPARAGDSFFDAVTEPGRTYDDLVARRVEGGPVRPYLRGRGLGGSGVINAMVALEGGPFRAMHRLFAEPARESELGPVDRALLAAAPDATAVPLTRHGGRRRTIVDDYPLDDVEVRGESHVDRVLLDGGRAVGVRLADGTEVVGDQVVVSAGAIGSPVILQRSEMRVLGIGDGLKDHPSVPLTLALRADAVADPASLATATLLRRGPVQVLPLNHVGREASGYGVLMPALMRVRSEGSVRIDDTDPYTPPTVDLRMLSHPDDLAAMVAAVRVALDLLQHPAFRAVVHTVHVDDSGAGPESLASDDGIVDWLREHVGDYVHAACTCRMGVVVDDAGQVRGHEALYICDASVFPDIPEVNTNLPTVMLAETLVDRWLRRAP